MKWNTLSLGESAQRMLVRIFVDFFKVPLTFSFKNKKINKSHSYMNCYMC